MESAFRDTCPPNLKVIETLGYAPGAGPVRAALHLERLAATCARLGIGVDMAAVRALLAGVGGDAPLRLRLTVALDGRAALETAPMAATRAPWRLAIAPERLDAADPWLTVKTTRRALYDRTRAALPDGIDEVIFLNGQGALAEGTITNVFLDTGRGLVTPPLSAGLLPGVLRRSLIEAGDARESDVSALDLGGARTIYVGNSLRGLIRAEMA